MTLRPCLGLLAGLALAAAGVQAWAQAAPQAQAQAQTQAPVQGLDSALAMRPVADGVYVHTAPVAAWGVDRADDTANVAFVVGSRCVAVIDSGGSPAFGRQLRAAISATTPLPVCLVVATHAHPDHILGHAAFSTGNSGSAPQFAAHAAYAAALGARQAAYRNAARRDLGYELSAADFVYPTLAVAVGAEQLFDLGDRPLLLRAWPTAHTDSDLTVYDRRSGTLFSGDLLFVDHVPVLDGRLAGWLAVVDALRALPAGRVVPGHGRVQASAGSGTAIAAWRDALDAERGYLLALQRDTRAAIKAHVTLAQAVDRIVPPATAPWLLVEQFQRRNVTAAYAELEWED